MMKPKVVKYSGELKDALKKLLKALDDGDGLKVEIEVERT